jgi:hypothetical protein
MRVYSLIIHITFPQGFLPGIVRSVGAKVVAILPKCLFEVSFDTDEAVSLEIPKDSLIGTHLILDIQQDKVLVSVGIRNDRVGTPHGVGDEKGDFVPRRRKAAQSFPRLSERTSKRKIAEHNR